MPALTELPRAFNVTSTTLRNWSAEFADHLPPSANPPKSETRSYSEEDVAVLALVAVMREENQPYAAIHAALADGGRLEWSPEEEKPQPEEEEEEQQLFIKADLRRLF